jgi:hypothetical protein
MLHIAGVDDVWEEHARLDMVLEQLPADGAAILLAHEPDFADESAATGRFDLQLSGHSHGGQVIYPFGGPPILPTYAKKYPVGRYQVSGMIQYTNRGLGMIPPHVRFNCRPEITVFTLSAKREADLCVSRFTFYDSTEKTGFNRRERCPSWPTGQGDHRENL